MANNAILTVTNPFEHAGAIVAGGGGKTDDLKYALPPADDITISAGMICSQTAAGTATPGLTATNSMPLWALNNIADYDVGTAIYGTAKGSPPEFGQALTNMTQEGNMNFVVGGRCYEIFTSEYVADTYLRDTLLEAGTGANLGDVQAVAALSASIHIVGQVSRGVINMPNRVFEGLGGVMFLWTRSQLATA